MTSMSSRRAVEMETEPAGADAMVEMLGLKRTGMRVAVAATIAVYIFIGLALPRLDMDSPSFVIGILGSIGLGAALIASVSGSSDPIGLPLAISSVVVGAVSGAAVWWSIPPDLGNWVRPSAPMVVYAIAMSLLIVRGRIRWAWVGFGLVILTCTIAVTMWGWRTGISVQVLLRMFLSLVPATLLMVFVRPLLRYSRVLNRREVAAVEAEAAIAATSELRRHRLLELERDVHPLLEKVAAGAVITNEDALRARLLEASLRDEVRGRGWTSPEVQAAVAHAREQGMMINLFDDRGVDFDSQINPGSIRAEFIRYLEQQGSGSITARLLPAGREVIATITSVDGSQVTRLECRRAAAGELTWIRDNDGAITK